MAGDPFRGATPYRATDSSLKRSVAITSARTDVDAAGGVAGAR